MNWHQPDLYLFLCKLAGLAALLAIAYELVRRRRKPEPVLPEPEPVLPEPAAVLPESLVVLLEKRQAVGRAPVRYLKNVRPLGGLQRDPPLPSEEGQAASNCEGNKDVPPKTQTSHERDHFGNFAGARPVSQHSRTRL